MGSDQEDPNDTVHLGEVSRVVDDAPATVTMAPGVVPSDPLPSGSIERITRPGSTRGRSTRGGSTHASRAGIADEVLQSEELARARGWALIVCMLGTSAFAMLPLLEMSVAGRVVFIASVGNFLGFAFYVLLHLRRHPYTRRLFRVWGYHSALMSVPLQYAVGPFAPTPLIITLGITFFGLGRDRRHAIGIPVVAVGGYIVLALIVALGWIPDIALYSDRDAPLMTELFFIVFVPFVFFVALWFARISRRSMLRAIERASEAQRVAGQREAQLMEAQQDLEEALRAGAGFGGRFTGQRAGAFELGDIVGRGAMGEVYRATEVGTGALAAVKVLRDDSLRDGAVHQRFVREGHIAGSLDVPNVVKVLDVGVMREGGPYIAMELLSGEDLGAVLRRTRQLELGQVIDIVTQVARGLDAAHAADIVHRDLKPGNIFLHRDGAGDKGTWKILDFGVSKLAGSEGTLTRGGVIGTPSYMAPEQARGRDADRRADTYALGAVVYRALTGRSPFSGPDTPRILFDVVYSMPPRPSHLRPGLPSDVDRVLAIALAKAPAHRFATAGELAKALAQAHARKLNRDLRSRADALIGLHPWGARIDGAGD